MKGKGKGKSKTEAEERGGWPLLHYRYHIRFKLVLWGLIAVFTATLLTNLLSPYISALLNKGDLNPHELSTFMLWFYELTPTVIYLVLASFLMAQLFRPITNRILALSHAARSISAGNFKVQVDTANRRDEVYQLTVDFNRMARELDRNELLRKDFISNVSHELKTPLAVIDGYADLLREDFEAGDLLSPAERSEYAALISHECKRLRSMCTNMLQVSRLDNQALPDCCRAFRLDEQLRQVLVFLEPRWAGKLTVVPELAEVTVWGNPELLEQVWSNLLDNAIKFTPSGGSIWLKLEEDSRGATVTVSDSGCGMSRETLDKVFEQFYQGETSHCAEGFGLGLYIVRRIIDLHGGSVWAASTEGEGSTFTVFLPHKAERTPN